MADCLAGTNKACHSGCVSAGLGTSRMDGCTLRPASRWSEMFAQSLLSFPTRLFVPEGCCCPLSAVRTRCGGRLSYQVSR